MDTCPLRWCNGTKVSYLLKPLMRLSAKILLLALALASQPTWPQEIAVGIARVRAEGLPRGQIVIDLTTQTRHPAYLEPQLLKAPDGIRILTSTTSPDNARTCPRAGPSQTECRQVFRVILDAGERCQAGGDYEALFRVACWPGTAASLCKPGAHQYNFKLGGEPLC